ncbi:MAG: BamA/TamA family outer membrane protein [Magnetococcales bacterium]|nr:BamA/TamA family outer membrane protein [Magnetococcales bacterium]
MVVLVVMGRVGLALGEGNRDKSYAYDVQIEGIQDKDLLTLLESNSVTIDRRNNPPLSLLTLENRVDSDRKTFLEALRSQGYYASRVDGRTQEKNGQRSVLFRIETGPMYQLGRIDIQTVNDSDAELPLPSPDGLGWTTGSPAQTAVVLDIEKRVLSRLKEQGRAFAALTGRDAVVIHQRRSLDLTLTVEPGPLVKLGHSTVTGLVETDRAFALERIPWQPGDLYKPELLQTAQRQLLDTGLFSTVRLALASSETADGLWPVEVVVTESLSRTIKAGVAYHTDRGPRFTAGWEHRNILGRAEKLALTGSISTTDAHALAVLTKPHFLLPNQTLSLESGLDLEHAPAYEKASTTWGVSLGRVLPSGGTLSVGGRFRSVYLQDRGTNDHDFEGLFSTPIRWLTDRSDDLFNPSQGWRANLQADPTLVLFGESASFVKMHGQLTGYHLLTQSPRMVLAGRFGAGIIAGPALERVLPDERFFSGGGGSIRGYGYQLASPLDEDRHPAGGLSTLEMAGEVRLDLTEQIQSVFFVDAGGAFKERVPNLNGDALFVSAGVGLRYGTPLGPLRLDVGVPLNRRDGVDDAVQVLLSIGQAF